MTGVCGRPGIIRNADAARPYGRSGGAGSRTIVYGMTTNPPNPPHRAHRITVLDALRGFALCGILLVNIRQIAHVATANLAGGVPETYPVPAALDVFVEERFFPIFSFLFGLSFAIFLETAGPRSAHPRLLLFRRLIALGALGLLHHQLQPGEALLPYAIIGLVILLPASWLPARVVLPGGLLLLGLSVTVAAGGEAAIPGLFLLGLAVARSGVARTLDRRARQIAIVLALAAPAAIAATWWQIGYPPAGPLATRIMSLAGLLTAVTYASGLLLLLRTTPGRAAARVVLEPLGRMALTNYITATLIIVAVERPLGLYGSAHWGTEPALAAAILTVQAVFSRWWLSRFRYGPLEWGLRTITWWQPVALRRPAEPAPAAEPRQTPAPEPRAPFEPRQAPYAPRPPYFPPHEETVLMSRQTPAGPVPAYDGPHWFETPWTGSAPAGNRA